MEYKENLNTTEDIENIDKLVDALDDVSENTSDVDVFEDSNTELEQEHSEEKQKSKKNKLYKAVVIALCVVLAAVVALGALYLFTPTVEGTWVYAVDDGVGGTIDFYFDFGSEFKTVKESAFITDEPTGDEHECTASAGTFYFPGIYQLSTTTTTDVDGNAVDAKVVSITNYGAPLYGDYTYTVSGNRLFGKRVLTLTSSDGTSYTLNQAKKPKDSEYISVDKDFTVNKDIIGEWEYEYVGYGLKNTLDFKKDGTVVYNVYGTQEIHCTYTVDEENITLVYFNTELQTQAIPYSIEDNGLVFMDVLWSRPSEATADQA